MKALSKLVLIGVGLIGGSFALDLKQHQLVSTVVGIDIDRDNLTLAQEKHIIDEAFNNICHQAIAGADLIVIATPVNTLPEICRQLAPLLTKNMIVSDVGSTKQSALSAFRTFLPQHFAHCVAAHPIAGSEQSGANAAQLGLYQHKKLILCPHEQQHSGSLKAVQQLWQTIGAETVLLDAAEHDAIFAAVSHFPHLLAFSYMHQILDNPQSEMLLSFAGSGFQDFTRLAASSAAMWKDIMLVNHQSLLSLIDAQQQQLNQLKKILEQKDEAALLTYLNEARQARKTWEKS